MTCNVVQRCTHRITYIHIALLIMDSYVSCEWIVYYFMLGETYNVFIASTELARYDWDSSLPVLLSEDRKLKDLPPYQVIPTSLPDVFSWTQVERSKSETDHKC